MRSLNYIAAALLPVINSAYAGNAGGDGTVVVTQTRTVYFCPIQDFFVCDDNVYETTTIERTGAPSTTTTTTTTTDLKTTTTGGSTVTTHGEPVTSTITTHGEPITSIITTGGGTITTHGEPITTIITTGKGNDTVVTTTIIPDPIISTTIITEPITITTVISEPGITTKPTSSGEDHGITKNGTTTGPTTTTGFNNGTSSITTSSSTTSGCFNSTRTAAPFSFGRGLFDACNKAGSRDLWCDGKTVNSDTEPVYSTGQTRKYRLEIGLGSYDGDGSGAIPVFTINGKTPGDAIVANWGDDVEITVVNSMDSSVGPTNATTIHWHGILQHGTNDQDGVPGVTECGIAPGTSRVYRWHASTYGTGWYHGHLLAQYGGGVRGPIIIHGPASSDYDLDMGPIMIDEKFTDSIFNVGKHYAFKRGSLAASNYLLNGKNANRFDANKGEAARWIVKSGKKHLFRIINSSAQSGFVFHIDQHKMTVISADFVPIQPYETENLYIHSGQRYNVIVKADQPVAAYDVRAMIQLGCGTDIANRGLGQVNGIMEYEGSCYSVPAASNYTLNTAGVCKDEDLSNLKPVVSQSAGSRALFDAGVKNMAGGTVGGAPFNVNGNITAVNRWLFGGETPFTGLGNGTATKGINVTFDTPTLQLLQTVPDYTSAIYGNSVFYNAKDQWVYWVIQNAFITSHPMHLHGHDFAILDQAYNKVFGADPKDFDKLNFVNPMRRDTVLLYGSGTPADPVSARQPGYTVIGFKTNNPGAWLMHCHIIWHADLGMGIQLVERASEIPNYAGKAEFQGECSDMKSYEASGSGFVKAQWESGLKIRDLDESAINRRHLEEHKFHGYSHGHAVRHA